MAEADSLKVIEAVENAMRARDWVAFANLHADDVSLHSPDNPEPLRGRAAVQSWYEGFVNGMPDLDAKSLRTFAQGEWVCGEYEVTGTHTGPLSGPEGESIPPTNKRIHVANCSVYKVKGGKVTEVHEYYDLMGFMAQLGLTP